MKKRNKQKARKRNPRGARKTHARTPSIGGILSAFIVLGEAIAVATLAPERTPLTAAQIVARRTDRLLDALSKALAAGDAATVERIKGVLSKLNEQPAQP